jgi:hypothetical protein
MVEMRKRTLLIALAVIGLGLIFTGLSGLYTVFQLPENLWSGISKISYGFPFGWYGYFKRGHPDGFLPVYWFSLESFLLDTAFWLGISTFGCFAIIKSMNMVHKARASKTLFVVNI